jgi:hypothetical protein
MVKNLKKVYNYILSFSSVHFVNDFLNIYFFMSYHIFDFYYLFYAVPKITLKIFDST